LASLISRVIASSAVPLWFALCDLHKIRRARVHSEINIAQFNKLTTKEPAFLMCHKENEALLLF
jgi:hypothetical protein